MSKNEVVTFGCRLNIFESEIIKNNSNKAGIKNAIIFNTCSVTNEAERQSLQAIRKAIRNNPDKKIYVTGCAAQLNPKKFSDIAGVTKVIGNNEKLHIDAYKNKTTKVEVSDIMSIKETNPQIISNFENKSRAYLQIQNGCNHRCTFCTIPYARGNSRSVPIGSIVEQAKELLKNNYQEIVLTGVDISDYGLDLPGQPKLGQMIKRLLNLVTDLKRLRISSIDVAEIDEELLDLIMHDTRIMPHLHISVQAGDNMILKRMKRRHSREQVVDFCNKVRAARPEIAFGADIIAGFPTETEEMFLNTKNLIKDAGLVHLHIFPFSEKNLAPASRMPQVEVKIRKKRAKILRSEGDKSLSIFIKNMIGKNFEVIVEKDNLARADNFVQVKLNKQAIISSRVQVKITGIDNNHAIGEILQ